MSFDPPRPWRFTVQASQGTAIVIMTASAVDDVEAEINPKERELRGQRGPARRPADLGFRPHFNLQGFGQRHQASARGHGLSREHKAGESTTVTVTFRVLPVLTENFTFTFRASDADQTDLVFAFGSSGNDPCGRHEPSPDLHGDSRPQRRRQPAVFFEADIEAKPRSKRPLPRSRWIRSKRRVFFRISGLLRGLAETVCSFSKAGSCRPRFSSTGRLPFRAESSGCSWTAARVTPRVGSRE